MHETLTTQINNCLVFIYNRKLLQKDRSRMLFNNKVSVQFSIKQVSQLSNIYIYYEKKVSVN